MGRPRTFTTFDMKSGNVRFARNKSRKRFMLPFIGVDGEGAGTDEHERQHYLLLRAGDRELYKDGRPLNTEQCLDFICSLEPDYNYVGFSFGYDVTMILRDLDYDRRTRLFYSKEERERLGFNSPYTLYRDFGIEYLPSQYFTVCRLDAKGRPIPKSSRTIYEVFGFFQCSFLKAIKTFDVGREYWSIIEAMKAGREDFQEMTAEVRHYCNLECQYLAELMERFRDVCLKANIKPKTWNGAGKLAAALHTQHETPKIKELSLPAELLSDAFKAYYGGRFEVMRTGQISGTVHEYDINSAYPAAMLHLPCLKHGRWSKVEGEPKSGPYLANIRFFFPKNIPLCGFPIRSEECRLSWPREGRGIYWHCEIEASRKLGGKVEVIDAWQYEKCCDCEPFKWVVELYKYRKSVGKSTVGYPIKLGINSLYGQLARRVGNGGPWTNFVWAGLITSYTRAALITAAISNPNSVVMFATDGVYSTAPLDVPISSTLGEWEHQECDGLFIVQPGLYWSKTKLKTRGVRGKFFIDYLDQFERTWADFYERMTSTDASQATLLNECPTVEIEINNFCGLRLATSQGKKSILKAGRWQKDKRIISFNWEAKRQIATSIFKNGHARTFPLRGSPDTVSFHPVARGDEFVSMAEEMQRLTEAAPEYIDFSNPGLGED